MTEHYTVIASNDACNEGIQQVIYKTTQLADLSDILYEVSKHAYDHVDLIIGDGEATVAVEVAS